MNLLFYRVFWAAVLSISLGCSNAELPSVKKSKSSSDKESKSSISEDSGELESGVNNNKGLETSSDTDNLDPTDDPAMNPNYKFRVASSPTNTCAIPESGDLYCWGYYARWMVGDGTKVNQISPVKVGTLKWKEITVGGSYACGISNADDLYCWGKQGEMATPTRIGNHSDWKSVSSSRYGGRLCGIRAEGLLYCWGSDWSTPNESEPVQIGQDNDWVQVSASYGGSCGIKANGEMHCWLGDFLPMQGRTTTRIGTDLDWVHVSGFNNHKCGIKKAGTLFCWLWTSLGKAEVRTNIAEPTAVGVESNWVKVMVTQGVTVVENDKGELYYWGGVGGLAPDGTVAKDVGMTKFVNKGEALGFDAGGRVTCIVKIDGWLYCSGWNKYGQVGDGTTVDRTNYEYKVLQMKP